LFGRAVAGVKGGERADAVRVEREDLEQDGFAAGVVEKAVARRAARERGAQDRAVGQHEFAQQGKVVFPRLVGHVHGPPLTARPTAW
jgi:hypothetical protein